MTDESVEALIGKRFISRRDVFAKQISNGGYVPSCTQGRHPHEGDCTYEAIKMKHLLDHVGGKATYGHYLLDTDSKCKFFCFDIDLDATGTWIDDHDVRHEFNPREAWRDPKHPAREDLTVQLRCMADGLAARTQRLLGIEVAIAYSGNKGTHVYGFTGHEPAADVRAAAMTVLEGNPSMEAETFAPERGKNFWKHVVPETGLNNLTIEVFPKQDTLGAGDFGNLMRMPLGIHRKSGQRHFFLDPNAPYNELREADAVQTLLHGTRWAS